MKWKMSDPSEKKYIFPYWGPYIMETHIDRELVDLLLEKGVETKLDARKDLAGQMNKEFYYEDYEDWFISRFSPYMNLYIEGLMKYLPSAFKYLYGTDTWFFPSGDMEERSWTLDKLWINYQQPGEYTPPHHHTGDLSFVIYLQIPRELIAEHEEKKDEHNNEGPGAICFQYGEQLPFSISRYWRLPDEGMFIIFPAWVQHYAHSFTSDVERISVSGNIRFKGS